MKFLISFVLVLCSFHHFDSFACGDCGDCEEFFDNQQVVNFRELKAANLSKLIPGGFKPETKEGLAKNIFDIEKIKDSYRGASFSVDRNSIHRAVNTAKNVSPNNAFPGDGKGRRLTYNFEPDRDGLILTFYIQTGELFSEEQAGNLDRMLEMYNDEGSGLRRSFSTPDEGTLFFSFVLPLIGTGTVYIVPQSKHATPRPEEGSPGEQTDETKEEMKVTVDAGNSDSGLTPADAPAAQPVQPSSELSLHVL